MKRVIAIKGSDPERTSFGDGASLLGLLDAAVNSDVADFLVRQIEDRTYLGKTPVLVN